MIPKSFDEHESSRRLGDDAMLSDNAMQRRNAFAVCASVPLDGLKTSLDRAREIAARNEYEAISPCLEEARRCLRAIRALHQGALDEFSAAQGE